jgi:hypothetical protein
LVVGLDVVQADVEQQRDDALPGGIGGEVGGAEDVAGGGSEVVAQHVAIGRSVDVVDLREPLALLVVKRVT